MAAKIGASEVEIEKNGLVLLLVIINDNNSLNLWDLVIRIYLNDYN